MQFDTVIAGGGLSAGLIVMALRHKRPAATIAVVERAGRLGGNHTWSFHDADVPPDAWPVISPLVSTSWPRHCVSFPGLERTLDTGYHSITSDHFDAVVRRAVSDSGGAVLLDAEVVAVEADRVRLANGAELTGRLVIDARGGSCERRHCGWQTFLGLEVELQTPWRDDLPTVMDATVAQDNGYRFVYVLPFTPTRVLVEDTYFSDSPNTDKQLLCKRVELYLSQSGQSGWRVLREESGALPMPWRGRIDAPGRGPIRAGSAGGWFHPATGYTVPVALRLALAVADGPPQTAPGRARDLARRLAWRSQFARFLNWLLFRLVKPAGRWKLFRRLYRALPAARLARFYALEMTPLDALRLIVGTPPPVDLLRPFSRREAAPCPPNC